MGLASKMAASQRPAAAGGQLPYPSGQAYQTPGAQAPAVSGPLGASGGSYGAPAPAYGQQSYGAPPGPPPAPYGQPQQSYGAPPSAPGQYGQPAQGAYGQPAQGAYGQPAQGQYGQPPQGQYGQPPQGQYGQPPQGQYGQPPQGQYGQPAQGQYGQPPQGQYGARPGQGPAAGGYGQAPQAGSYGQPPAGGSYGQPVGQPGAPAGAVNPQMLLQTLQQCVQEQKLQAFYPNVQDLQQVAQRVAQSGALQHIATEWRLPMEVAADLIKLALFDTVLYIDDSGSMAFEENGSRIDDLKLIVGRVAYATSLVDADGISVRFMNSQVGGDHITNESGAQALVNQVKFSGLTPIGTNLRNKVLEPFILGPARQNRLPKPVLVIAVTDGAPAGEDRNTLANVVIEANRVLQSTRYGPDALSLQIAQVGGDLKARQFLEELDNHPVVGGLIDSTSNYELEADEMLRKSGMELSPDLWLCKLLLGAVDASYDSKDEH